VIASNIDDAAKKSNDWWKILGNKQLLFQDRAAMLAPWPLSSSDPAFVYAPTPTVTHQSPSYRNRQYIPGAYDVETLVESKQGDGIVTSWTTAGLILSITSLLLNGVAQTFGVVGTAGVSFLYTEGTSGIAQAQGAVPLSDQQILTITYQGQIDYTGFAENTAQQAVLAALDGTTGIVEAQESGAGLNAAAADALAAARIAQYAVLSHLWRPTIKSIPGDARPPPQVGMLLSCFAPEFALNDDAMLIGQIDTIIAANTDGSIYTTYTLYCTDGPLLGSWSRIFILN